MARKDYYATLGVDRSASAEDLKRAYRTLAMKYHPDRTAGDKAAEERFKEVSEAYAVLSDPEKRKTHDRGGEIRDVFGGVDPGDGRTITDIFGDIFGDLFGGGRGRPGGGRGRAGRGRDLRTTVALSFEEAARGVERTVAVPRRAGCRPCAGSGAAPGSPPIPCEACRGTGQVRAQQGFFPLAQACGKCDGTGRIIRKRCGACGGAGHVATEERLTVRVPAGVADGQRLRVPGKGGEGENGGPAGHLIVVCAVAAHPVLRRAPPPEEGGPAPPDLHVTVPITFVEASLGGRVSVPTLDGPVKMKIPPGTQTGKVFRLAGKGIRPTSAAGTPEAPGDLRVTVQVETPVELSEEALELLRRLDRAVPDRAYPERARFADAALGGRPASGRAPSAGRKKRSSS